MANKGTGSLSKPGSFFYCGVGEKIGRTQGPPLQFLVLCVLSHKVGGHGKPCPYGINLICADSVFYLPPAVSRDYRLLTTITVRDIPLHGKFCTNPLLTLLCLPLRRPLSLSQALLCRQWAVSFREVSEAMQ